MAARNDESAERNGGSTSRSLLERVHADEPAAWDRLVALYAPLVWHWCRKMGLPPQEIGDVFQEVFRSVAANFRAFRRDRPGDTFRGWLRVVTKNKVHDHRRQRQHEPQAAGGTEARAWWSTLPDQPPTNDEDERVADHALFRRALAFIQDGFEEKTWKAFWGVVVDGRAPQDVGADLGMSPGAVRVAKCRVLQRLRRELGDIPEGESPL